MDYQEARYITDYFSRLMTDKETKANKHYFFSVKLGKPENYENLDSYEYRKSFFEKRNAFLNDSTVLDLLESGYENFILKTAERIERETPNQYRVNRCKKCNFIARTPYAKQCKKCKNNWHNEIRAELLFDSCIRITGSKYFWIVGEVVRGEVLVNDKIDLTNFQLNIIPKIKQIDSFTESDIDIENTIRLGININSDEEKLITQYVKRTVKKIMILKE